MTTYTAKILAHKYIPSSEGDLAAPASGKWQIHTVEIHNTNTSTENVVLYLDDGTTKLRKWNMDIDANDTVLIQYSNEGLPLDSANSAKISGYTTTADKVSISFYGSEVS